MSRLLNPVRLAIAATLVALWASPGLAAWICERPILRPGPESQLPVKLVNLLGTDYKISGINSRLPAPTSPATVKFDGIAETVGAYIVNESIRQIVNGQGRRETWIDFEFTQNPTAPRPRPRSSSALAEDMGVGWRVNLTDFSLPADTEFPEFYMYFTEQGTPAPFGRRPSATKPVLPIVEHPFLDNVSVLRDQLIPFAPGDFPPGATNALVSRFEHYFSAVHDVERGMGVSRGVDGFHLGYRVAEVPEPSTCLSAIVALIGSTWMLRRRRMPHARMNEK